MSNTIVNDASGSKSYDNDTKDGARTPTTHEVPSIENNADALFKISPLYRILPYGYSRKRMITRGGAKFMSAVSLLMGGLTLYVSAYNLSSYGSVSTNAALDAMLNTSDTTISSRLLAAKQGGITSINSFGMIVGALAGGWLTTSLGRTKSISTALAIGCFGMALQTASQNLTWFLISRFITGFGIGMSDSTVPTWIAEISATAVRGGSIALELSFAGIGIASAYWLGYGLSFSSNLQLGWRFIIAYPLVVYLPVCIFFSFLPESPRWLVSVGMFEEAEYVLSHLRKEDSSQELKDIIAYCEMQRQNNAQHGYLAMLFKRDHENTRRRAWLTILLQFMATFFLAYGIVVAYASTVLGFAGYSAHKTTILVGCNAINYPLWFYVGVSLTDRVGRRALFIAGSTGAGVLMMILGALSKYIIRQNGNASSAAGSALVACVFLYAAFHGFSWACVGWVYPVEIFPQATRSRGGALSIASFSTGFTLLTMIAPYMFTSINENVFFVFGSLTLLSVPIVYCFYPETRQRTLEDIYHLFTGPIFVWQAEKHYQNVLERQRQEGEVLAA
ncbi:hypothetical protein L486_08283 [Kwoniella mangroviensis CBS 10435]|uniref:Major facilitator superfamily (MFS) profile domain-containing protein n=1 Tax=Kwoniella mangroviensis CBS 10435 TaxID=1331196 RepID=A0A1B9IFF0_9TREE|nr:uncharacterized protein I203_08306 [Kwoniella mangroviensis CBS 8507]OCF54369.1 hypothetical protein L486_08283 [Kwoniella mangroviensis CBS 10435]OCF62623.1 hypothetical protein I203_08306 [Kwoniella mangroviensis CBS 8507]